MTQNIHICAIPDVLRRVCILAVIALEDEPVLPHAMRERVSMAEIPSWRERHALTALNDGASVSDNSPRSAGRSSYRPLTELSRSSLCFLSYAVRFSDLVSSRMYTCDLNLSNVL